MSRYRFSGLVAIALLAIAARVSAQPAAAALQRPVIGVAFGGGSARGLAHVGVIRWFEEHHIPIDRIAGTSMGGLVGGAYAAGMSADDLARVLASTDWDAMFGSSTFQYKNIRRKQDARVYPSRIEFGLKKGVTPPVALNNGQQVDFLITRLASAYSQMSSFDELPTPFRSVAVDLLSAQAVVLDRGSLATAMRATMSLPGVFPPVEINGQVLVDGGAMNNVPADIARGMGANVVIAINVAGEKGPPSVNYSVVGLMGQTVDAMMEANTRIPLKSADIVINPPLSGFGSLDWRRSEALALDGYQAAEAMRDTLLPLALDEKGWAAYQTARQSRRRPQLATPQFLSIVGAVPSDQRRIEEVLRAQVGQPLDIAALESELAILSGLDRYETIQWQLVEAGGRQGLEILARPKPYAPPFLMLGVSLENTTTDEFAFQFAARYLRFDVAGSGSELRLDAAVGAEPRLGGELYRPLGRSPFFVAASAFTGRRVLNFISDDTIVAKYNQTRSNAGLEAGVNLSRVEELRGGVTAGYLRTSISAGDPGLPELSGAETRAHVRWLHNNQDSPVVPSGGVRAVATLSQVFDSPEAPASVETDRSNVGLTQGEIRSSAFWSLRRRHRLFVVAAGGTSFDDKPLPTEQFVLGRPMYLGASDLGEFRGDHYAVVTAGYLHGIGRMPDFLGGPIFAGGWLENGSAFDDFKDATLRTNGGVGLILDTLIGPMLVGSSFSFDGDWRYYLAIGRIF